MEVDADENGPSVMARELENVTKEMKGKKVKDKDDDDDDDDVPGDVLKLLGENRLSPMAGLINNVYETGEWPKDFTAVVVIALKKSPNAKTCNDHCTCSKDSSEDA
jgi:hypothetical protein